MPVKEEAEENSSSSSSSSSSGSDSSSSDSDSSSSSSSSSGSGSSSSSPKKNGKGGGAGSARSRSCSSARSGSRSRASSLSSASSAKSKKSVGSKKKAPAVPAVSSTTAPEKGKSKKPPAAQAQAPPPKRKPPTTKAIQPNSNATNPSQKKGEGVENKAQAGPKSKVIKSGSVTNTRTIKPLVPPTAPAQKKKVPVAGKPTPSQVQVKKEQGKGSAPPTTSVKRKPPTTRPPDKKEDAVKKKVEKNPSPKGVKTRASSCSSTSGTTSSSSDSSSGEEGPEDSSMTESSPTKKKATPTKVGQKKGASVVVAAASKKIPIVGGKKPGAVRNLTAELLSSAEESADESGAGSPKKKQPHTRRPLTRRQKSGVKKTIPTTTVFNQSLLLAASKAAESPKQVAASSSTELPLSRISSCIVNRRSTSNSSLSSSETESPEKARKRLPLAYSSSRNKYLSTWDSDFSDDNFSHQVHHTAANFIRVPAKTSNRSRAIDFGQNSMDEDYELPRCPFPSCDSTGHLSGKYPTHNFLSCCPKYHGFETNECTENEQERSKREGERARYRNVLSTPGKKPPKQTPDTKAWLTRLKDLKEVQTSDGLVSQYDALLWKDSLAIAADRIEKEQNDGITGQGIPSRYSMAVAMGRFEMKCWCASPYPEPLSQNRRLFVCEFCLKPVGSGTVLRRHCAKCVWRHPPGDEIYRKDRLSVWEVDGKKQKTYCQNLCLLAKCFLDHKTLYLDVDPFLFYVMTLADSQGCHLVGYFSKEKNSFLNYNVSCILTLPPYMRQGFGRLLIDFSYLLTRVEGKIGSPEKPLSDLGLISYRSYWKDAVLRRLCACASREINIKDLSIELGVSTADLISTLQFLGMLKYWKGKHLVLKKQDVLEEYLERVRRRGNERQIDSSCLRWRPYQPPLDEHSSSEKS